MSGVFTLCLAVAAVCYLASALCAGAGLFFADQVQRDQARRQVWQRAALGAALAGFALHSAALLLALLGFIDWDNSYFLHLTAWVFMLVYPAMRGRVQADFLNMVCACPAFLLLLAGLAMRHLGLTQLPGAAYFSGPLFTIHVAAMFTGLSCMVIGCGAGLAFLHLERKIKLKTSLAGLGGGFPALTGLDRAGRLAVLWGLPLFSLGLAAGFVWSSKAWGGFSWDIKEIVSGLVWLLYAWLFYIRLQGRTGRYPARLAVWVFGLSMFSLLVVNIFLPSHHSFAPWHG